MAAGNPPNPQPPGTTGRTTDRLVSQDSNLSMTGVAKLVSAVGTDFKAESQGRSTIYTDRCFRMGDTIFFKSTTWMAEGRIKLSITSKEPVERPKKEDAWFQLLRTPTRYRVDLEDDKVKIFRLTDDNQEHLDKTLSVNKDKMPCWFLFQLRCGRVSMMNGKENDAISTGSRERTTSGRDDTISTGSSGPADRRPSSGSSSQTTPPQTPMVDAAVSRNYPQSIAPPIPARPGQPRARASGPLDKFREMKQTLREDAERSMQEVRHLREERRTVQATLESKKAKIKALTDEIGQLNLDINSELGKLTDIDKAVEESETHYSLIQKELKDHS